MRIEKIIKALNCTNYKSVPKYTYIPYNAHLSTGATAGAALGDGGPQCRGRELTGPSQQGGGWGTPCARGAGPSLSIARAGAGLCGAGGEASSSLVFVRPSPGPSMATVAESGVTALSTTYSAVSTWTRHLSGGHQRRFLGQHGHRIQMTRWD